MRYQSAYNYPGAKTAIKKTVAEQPRWIKKTQKRHQYDQSLWLRIMCFVLIVTGSLLLVVGLPHFYRAQSAQNWQQVTATVTQAEVVRMKHSGSAPIFTAKLKYVYTLNGKEMTGTRLSVAPLRSTSPSEIKSRIAAYSPGRTIVALVNQTHPDQAFLKTQPNTYLIYFIIPGLLLISISLAIGQVQYMRAKQAHRKSWKYGDWSAPVPARASIRPRT